MSTIRRLSCAGLITCSVLTSCIDNAYDLNNIDKTVGTSTDVTLPLSSTGDITIASFLQKDNEFIDSVSLDDGLAKVLYLTMTADLTFDIDALKDGSITLPESPNTSIRFDNIPDILKGDNLYLDLSSPILTLYSDNSDVSSESIVLETSASMESYLADQIMPFGLCSISGIKIPAGLARIEMYDNGYSPVLPGMEVPEDARPQGFESYMPSTPAWVTQGKLSSIITTLPERIDVELNNFSASGVGAGRVLQGPFTQIQTYHLYAPLCIGPKLHFEYDINDLDGWDGTFEDISDLYDHNTTITITADIRNNSPMEAVISANPRFLETVSGSFLPSVDPVRMAPNSTGKLTYKLRSLDSRYEITDYLLGRNGAPQLIGITPHVDLSAVPSSVGQYLRSDAGVQFTNISIHVKGDIIYNAK